MLSDNMLITSQPKNDPLCIILTIPVLGFFTVLGIMQCGPVSPASPHLIIQILKKHSSLFNYHIPRSLKKKNSFLEGCMCETSEIKLNSEK